MKNTYVQVPANAPSAYWENWAEQVPAGQGPYVADGMLLRTFRSGRDGESDARYIVDRLASGLYFGSVLA